MYPRFISRWLSGFFRGSYSETGARHQITAVLPPDISNPAGTRFWIARSPVQTRVPNPWPSRTVRTNRWSEVARGRFHAAKIYLNRPWHLWGRQASPDWWRHHRPGKNRCSTPRSWHRPGGPPSRRESGSYGEDWGKLSRWSLGVASCKVVNCGKVYYTTFSI